MLTGLLDELVQTLSVIKIFFSRGNGAFAEVHTEDKEKIAQLRSFHFFLLRFAQRFAFQKLSSKSD